MPTEIELLFDALPYNDKVGDRLFGSFMISKNPLNTNEVLDYDYNRSLSMNILTSFITQLINLNSWYEHRWNYL